MPTPTASTTIERPDLAGPAYEYVTRRDEFIGLSVLPIFGVPEPSLQFAKIPMEALLELPDDLKRANDGSYAMSDFEFETDSFRCQEYGFAHPINPIYVKIYKRFFDVEQACTERAAMILMRAQEKRIADKIMNTSTFANTARTAVWTSAANSRPINDVQAAKKVVWDATGVEPNVVIMSKARRMDLNYSEQIIERVKYTVADVRFGELPDKLIAEALGIDQIKVAKARYNTKARGIAGVSASIWPEDKIWVGRVADSNNILEPAVGFTFLYTEDSPTNLVVETYSVDGNRMDYTRVRHFTDEYIINPAAGHIVTSLTS